jgi:histidinol-phosphate aminotransferase
VLRTFSKIYGMAGFRAGFAMARPDLLGKLRQYGAGMQPILGLTAGTASLKVKNLVPERRALCKQIRESTFEFFEKKNIKYVPSEANFFMMEVGRPHAEFADAMRKEKIIVGREWRSWPTKVRVTVGTQAEMDKFKAAVAKVMA